MPTINPLWIKQTPYPFLDMAPPPSGQTTSPARQTKSRPETEAIPQTFNLLGGTNPQQTLGE